MSGSIIDDVVEVIMSANDPRVSIGMPVYNGEKFIEAAIESISAQTYDEFELIISDNASTDRTATICLDYAARDKRIHYYRNDENLGAAPNFNRVFELSTGEYFKWAACDDVIAPEFISQCLEALDQNSTVVLCYSRSNIIDENGQFLGVHKLRATSDSSKPHIRFRDLALKPDTGFQVFGLMRANVAKKTALIGNYPASDLVFLAELALYGKFLELPAPLFFPRYHPDQSTKGSWSVERDRTLWFDTSLRGKIMLPKWRYLIGYLDAIRRAPVGRYNRIYCYSQMVRWVLMPDHMRALGKDTILAASKLMVRTFVRPKTTPDGSTIE